MHDTGWMKHIIQMAYIRQKIDGADTKHVWTLYWPEVKATEAEIAGAERHIGERLPDAYRTFLGFADGWRSFWHGADLFGTADLAGGARMLHATSLLDGAMSGEGGSLGCASHEVIPIGVQMRDVDVFLLSRRASRFPGAAIWLAGDEVERFPTFREFFLSMMDYNRSTLRELLNGTW